MQMIGVPFTSVEIFLLALIHVPHLAHSAIVIEIVWSVVSVSTNVLTMAI